jgi:hypothetical protein
MEKLTPAQLICVTIFLRFGDIWPSLRTTDKHTKVWRTKHAHELDRNEFLNVINEMCIVTEGPDPKSDSDYYQLGCRFALDIERYKAECRRERAEYQYVYGDGDL